MLAFPPEFYRLGLSGFVIVIAFCASKLGQEHNPRIRHVSCPVDRDAMSSLGHASDREKKTKK